MTLASKSWVTGAVFPCVCDMDAWGSTDPLACWAAVAHIRRVQVLPLCLLSQVCSHSLKGPLSGQRGEGRTRAPECMLHAKQASTLQVFADHEPHQLVREAPACLRLGQCHREELHSHHPRHRSKTTTRCGLQKGLGPPGCPGGSGRGVGGQQKLKARIFEFPAQHPGSSFPGCRLRAGTCWCPG